MIPDYKKFGTHKMIHGVIFGMTMALAIGTWFDENGEYPGKIIAGTIFTVVAAYAYVRGLKLQPKDFVDEERE